MDRRQFLDDMAEALNVPKGSLHEEDRLSDLEGLDSLGAIAVIMVIDERYHVPLSTKVLTKCQSLADLIGLVEDGSASGAANRSKAA